MTDTPGPDEIPVYEDTEGRDRQYREAQAAGEPYFAVERGPEGAYAVTFDLLPAGAQLDPAARDTLRERLVADVEALVADESDPTSEVSHSLSPSLGSVSGFDGVTAARDVAATMATVVLNREHWEANTEDHDSAADPRTN